MKRFLALLIFLALTGSAYAVSDKDTVIWKGGSYTRHPQIPIASATLVGGATCPARNTVATGQQFNQNADLAYFQLEVPSDWDGGAMYVEIDWYSTTDIANTETVIWKWAWAWIAEGEDLDSQAPTTDTVTYTSSGVTSAGTMIHSRLTIPASTITKQDHIYLNMYRDATADTFGGVTCGTAYEFLYNSNDLPGI